MKKNCLKCGKEYEKKPNQSRKEWGTRMYCSKSCANSVNMKGKRHTLGLPPWNKGKAGLSGWLSPSWKGGAITLVCRECESLFLVKAYRKFTAHFCSQECSHRNRDQGKRPLHKKIRQSARYKAWRTLVFERDDYVCQECGIKNGLGKTIYFHADHIKPFAFYPELRFEVSNGRTLCVSCHHKTPTYGANGWRLHKKSLAVQEA